MTLVALSPLQQQGDVSRILAALPAVLLQDLGAPPTATPSHVQGPSSPPTATLACTQGLGTPLPDTLVHSYAPRCTSGSSPYLYKREVQDHPEGGSRQGSGGRAPCPSLSLTRRACNPYCERHPWCRIIQGLSHLLCSIPCQPIWTGTRSDFTGRSKGPSPWVRDADRRVTLLEADGVVDEPNSFEDDSQDSFEQGKWILPLHILFVPTHCI
jgi:hypothetical protein